MDRKAVAKLVELRAFIPFMKYLLDLNAVKYAKMKEMIQWILANKRYTLDVLVKMEQSIFTQYKNLLIEDVKIPLEFVNVFSKRGFAVCETVDLCSDDETSRDGVDNNIGNAKEEKSKIDNTDVDKDAVSISINDDDDDDDVIFIESPQHTQCIEEGEIIDSDTEIQTVKQNTKTILDPDDVPSTSKAKAVAKPIVVESYTKPLISENKNIENPKTKIVESYTKSLVSTNKNIENPNEINSSNAAVDDDTSDFYKRIEKITDLCAKIEQERENREESETLDDLFNDITEQDFENVLTNNADDVQKVEAVVEENNNKTALFTRRTKCATVEHKNEDYKNMAADFGKLEMEQSGENKAKDNSTLSKSEENKLKHIEQDKCKQKDKLEKAMSNEKSLAAAPDKESGNDTVELLEVIGPADDDDEIIALDDTLGTLDEDPTGIADVVESVGIDEPSNGSNNLEDLEKLNMQELNNVYKKLTQDNPIDLQIYLQELYAQVQQHDAKLTDTTPTVFLQEYDDFMAACSSNSPSDYNECNMNAENYASQQITKQPQPINGHCVNYAPQPNGIMQPQQQNYVAPHNNQPNNFRLNLKDPRIVRQLQLIQKSHVHSALTRDAAALLTQQIMQQQTQREPVKNVAPAATVPCTYGEHKRLQAQKKQQKLLKQQQEKEAAQKAQEAEKQAQEAEKQAQEAEKQAQEAAQQKRRQEIVESEANLVNAAAMIEVDEDALEDDLNIMAAVAHKRLQAQKKQQSLVQQHQEQKLIPEFEVSEDTLVNCAAAATIEADEDTLEDDLNIVAAVALARKRHAQKTKKRRRIVILDSDEDAENITLPKTAAEAAERLETDEVDKRAAVKVAAEKVAVNKVAADKVDAEKRAADKIAADKRAVDRLVAAERLRSERVASEKIAAHIVASEIIPVDRLTTEKVFAEILDADMPTADSIAADSEASESIGTEDNETDAEDARKPKQKPKNNDYTYSRALRELECTVIGFDQLLDYLPRTVTGTRKSSETARSAITRQLNGSNSNIDYAPEIELERTRPPKRRASMCLEKSLASARTTTAATTVITPAPISKRRKTCCELLDNTKNIIHTTKKETITTASETATSSSDTDPFDDIDFKNAQLKAQCLKNQPYVRLQRLSATQLSRLTRRTAPPKQRPKQLTISVELVQSGSAAPPMTLSDSAAAARVKPRNTIANTDASMTERSNKFCALCRSKPKDLVNHYVRVHKSEPYVSRLTPLELEELQISCPFAVLCTQSVANARTQKYQLNCVFCQEQLRDNFLNFHMHYSQHTGEYAFQCSQCKLQKPYRAQVQSHRLQSKQCRAARTETLYVYAANLMVIYLHCCTLCNFVQLNEANVYKHLREQHGAPAQQAAHVQRYVAAAINDGEIVNAVQTSDEEEEAEEVHVEQRRSPALARPSNSQSSTTMSSNSSSQLMSEAYKLECVTEEPTLLLCGDNNLNVTIKQELLTQSPRRAQQELMPVINIPRAAVADLAAAELAVAELVAAQTAAQQAADDLALANQAAAEIAEVERAVAELVAAEMTNATSAGDGLSDDGLAAIELAVAEMAAEQSKQPPPALTVPLPMFIKQEWTIIDEATTDASGTESASESTSVVTDVEQQTNSFRNFRMSQPETNPALFLVDPANSATAKSAKVNSDSVQCVPTPPISVPITNATALSNQPHTQYRHFASDIYYFGIYKCMADDCFYSTNTSSAMVQHSAAHGSSECPPSGFLNCSNCRFEALEGAQLVEHIKQQHYRSRFQCAACCYRSCLPDHVMTHRQQAHLTSKVPPFIYECVGGTPCNRSVLQLMRLMSVNVKQLKCNYCVSGFFSVEALKKHLEQRHFMSTSSTYPEYACVYCVHNSTPDKIHQHLALKHPDELAFACRRILKKSNMADALTNLMLCDMQRTVEPTNIRTAPSPDTGDSIRAATIATPPLPTETVADFEPADLKFSSTQLEQLTQDALRSLLHRLTVKTGLSRDRLYHCPETACGGFFSTHALWTRHMQLRHKVLSAHCPHCDSDEELKLEQFAQHFEQHCRQLYVCYHCARTFVNEQQVVEHFKETHGNDYRLEAITMNATYSYHIVIAAEKHSVPGAERLEFLQTLRENVLQRLEAQQSEQCALLPRQWPLQAADAPWLEQFPPFHATNNGMRRCISKECSFRTPQNAQLFAHIKAQHPTTGHRFSCYKCTFEVNNYSDWDTVIDHIIMHYSDLYVCCVCGYFHHARQQLSQHIGSEHNLRDTPLLHLRRSTAGTDFSLCYLFAAGCKTFATLQTCVFCAQSPGDNYSRHLKQAHNVLLSYYCDICHEALAHLSDADAHQQRAHVTQPLKLYCVLGCSKKLHIQTIRPLSVTVLEPKSKLQELPAATTAAKQDNTLLVKIKKELPDDADSDIEIIEGDDVVCSEEIKARRQLLQAVTTAPPRIRCINVGNLLESSVTTAAATTETNVAPATSGIRCINMNSLMERSVLNATAATEANVATTTTAPTTFTNAINSATTATTIFDTNSAATAATNIATTTATSRAITAAMAATIALKTPTPNNATTSVIITNSAATTAANRAPFIATNRATTTAANSATKTVITTNSAATSDANRPTITARTFIPVKPKLITLNRAANVTNATTIADTNRAIATTAAVTTSSLNAPSFGTIITKIPTTTYGAISTTTAAAGTSTTNTTTISFIHPPNTTSAPTTFTMRPVAKPVPQQQQQEKSVLQRLLMSGSTYLTKTNTANVQSTQPHYKNITPPPPVPQPIPTVVNTPHRTTTQQPTVMNTLSQPTRPHVLVEVNRQPSPHSFNTSVIVSQQQNRQIQAGGTVYQQQHVPLPPPPPPQPNIPNGYGQQYMNYFQPPQSVMSNNYLQTPTNNTTVRFAQQNNLSNNNINAMNKTSNSWPYHSYTNHNNNP